MEQWSEHIATRKWQLKFFAPIDIFEISCTRVFTQNNKALPWGKSNFFLLQITWLIEMHLQRFQRLPIFIWAFTGKSVSSHCIFRHWTTTEVELVQLRKSNWLILNTAVDYYKNIFKNFQIFDKLCWPERKLHYSTIL